MTTWQQLHFENQEMVDKFTRLAIIQTKEVEDAFRCVNRAAFVSKEILDESFLDAPITGNPHIHMSAPHMYAAILEDLELEPGMSFLNIGCGTGYFSCLAGYIIKKQGINHGVEIHKDLVEFSHERMNDFFQNGPADVTEICYPLLINGNAFQLDPSQMKYDRLYCGGACSQTGLTFFLEFLKVGGFLIAPVGSKLIKLERVSQQEGVKTVLNDVSFAALTHDITRFRGQRQTLIRFPISRKKRKPKKIIFGQTNFPVSKSPARRKMTRLRALQHVLDSLLGDEHVIPHPFCYTPNIDQLNSYKRYKKVLECTGESKRKTKEESGTSTPQSNASQPEASSSSSSITRNLISAFHGLLMSTDSFLQDMTSDSFGNALNLNDTRISGNSADSSQRRVQIAGRSGIAKPKSVIEYNDQECELQGDESTDIFQHVCSDKLWETVVDYYYSLCATSKERQNQCLRLKGVPIVHSTATKLADVLLFRMNKNKTKKKKIDVGSPPTDSLLMNSPSESMVESDLDAHSLDSSGSFIVSDSERSPENPSSTSQVVKTRKKKTQIVDIETDLETSNNISKVSSTKWTHTCDIELISHLASLDKETESFSLRDTVPKELQPDMFEQSKLLKYPLLSTLDEKQLFFRAIGLLRVAKILDSVLGILVGPSLPRNQFENPFKESFSLSSFTERSFDASDSQLNVYETKQSMLDERRAKCSEETQKETANEEPPEETSGVVAMKEVKEMIEHELNNVNQQQSILMKKFHLIDSINDQYKEQISLLNQQIGLIDEQHKLLVEVHLEAGRTKEVATEMASSRQLVSERKQHRLVLLGKRDKIITDLDNQLSEKKELMKMLEQLLMLQTRLEAELVYIKEKGVGYLAHLKGQADGSRFSEFVESADGILKKLRSNASDMKMAAEGKLVEKEKKNEVKTAHSLRYQPDSILPRCRFLMPLSKKRHNFVREMLRSTERPPPKNNPVINVDRRIALTHRALHGPSSTVFMQIYGALKRHDLKYRWSKKTNEQWWEVKFNGEGIIDQGGGFRESLAEISEELCPSSTDHQTCLPLFIKTPNQVSNIGDNLDAYTLNPNCKQFHLYRWLGQLFGACFRTDETIPLPLPPLIWKLLVGERVSWKDDFSAIDETTVNNIDGLDNVELETYKALNVEQTYSTVLSDQTKVDLIPGGSQQVVKCQDRSKFSKMVRKARLTENIEQVKAVREGLISVIPEAVLFCLTWRDLELAVCGSPIVSLRDLKANCRYGDRLSSTSQSVINMWSAVSTFTNEERCRFLRFITGRKRLPSPFIVSRASISEQKENDSLPSASTCGSNLFLPDYKSVEVATEKIRYAIYNCVAIDTDTSPW